MNQYGVKQYWDNRYLQDNEPFDWYQRFSSIKHIMMPILQRFSAPRILVVGCGNSRLSEELYMEGYKNIMNIDYSDICIKQMQDRYTEFPEMKFMCMDCKDIVFEEAFFDVVIDKGTLDSILCTEGATDNSHKALKEISRVLKPGGVYFCISYGVPAYRMHYLKWPEYDWAIDIEKVQKPMFESLAKETNGAGNNGDAQQKRENELSYNYIYICQKSMNN